MALEGKELREIVLSDIEFLIANEVAEDVTLEYKEKPWERNDEGTRELLRDISSMANARGGHILVGIQEDPSKDGIPIRIVGVSDHEREMQRIMNVCLASIDEKILGLDVVALPYQADKHILVIRVPKSTRVPHMITFKGLYQCWRRHGKQKNVMSIDEIRESCLKVESIWRDLEDFVEERKRIFLHTYSGQVFLFIAACPILVKNDTVDIFDATLRHLLENPPAIRPKRGSANLDCRNAYGMGWRPTLYGIKANLGNAKCLEVFRNGYVEFVVEILAAERELPHDGSKISVLLDWMVVEYIANFMTFMKAFLIRTSIQAPIVISIILANVRKKGLYKDGIPQFDLPVDVPSIWEDGDHLILPSMQVKSLLKPLQPARLFTDRIWNAFGFEKSPFFDAEGNFSIPRARP